MTIDKTSTIVVTGGNGFLGKALAARMASEGYVNVKTFSSRQFNLTDMAQADRMFFYFNPEAVIHLAAVVGGIGANMRNPGKFAYENAAMGLNVIELCRRYEVRKLVTVGTICSYPKFCPIPFKEQNLWEGYPEQTNAPYGIAKKMLMVLSQAYRQQYGCNFVYLLPVNMYGPEDSFDLDNSHVIPAMLRKFHETKQRGDEAVVLWGDGTPTREFLYVDDCAEAILCALEKYDGPEPINVGTGLEISMNDLAEMIKAVTMYNGTIYWDTSKPNGQPRRCLDVSRAKELLGWSSKTVLKEGLEATYGWFLQNWRK